MRVLTAALTFALVVPHSPLSAQQLPSVGETVRVSQCHSAPLNSLNRKDRCERHSGTLSARSTSTFTVRVEDRAAEHVFALDSVARIEVKRGRKSNTRTGAIIGLLAGGGLGAIAGAKLCDMDTPCEGAGERLAGAAMGAIYVGTIVGGFGALVGLIIRSDRWEEVPLDRLRVSFAPRRDRSFAIGVRLAF